MKGDWFRDNGSNRRLHVSLIKIVHSLDVVCAITGSSGAMINHKLRNATNNFNYLRHARIQPRLLTSRNYTSVATIWIYEKRWNEERRRRIGGNRARSTIQRDTVTFTTNFLQQHANSIFHEIFIREESHTQEENLAKRTSLSWHAQAYVYLYIVRALHLHTRLEQSDKSFHNFSERTKRGKGSNYVRQGGSSNTFCRCTIK